MSEENRKIAGNVCLAFFGSDDFTTNAGPSLRQLIAQALDEAERRGEDQGANLAAFKLREIAETGEHVGTFGGTELEAAAQAILKARIEAERRGPKP